MKLSDLFSMSLRGLTTNKMRSALTMLGVIIGVASVIALVSVGEGARKDVIENFESIGTNILKLYMNRWDTRLTVDQIDDLKKRVPDLEMALPQVHWGGRVTYEGKEWYACLLYTSRHILEMVSQGWKHEDCHQQGLEE